MAKVTAYLLRVDELSGVSYQGYLAEVEDSLEAYQDYVNYGHPHGRIQAVEVGGLAVVCNAEGKAYKTSMKRIRYDLSLDFENGIERMLSLLDIDSVKKLIESNGKSSQNKTTSP